MEKNDYIFDADVVVSGHDKMKLSGKARLKLTGGGVKILFDGKTITATPDTLIIKTCDYELKLHQSDSVLTFFSSGFSGNVPIKFKRYSLELSEKKAKILAKYSADEENFSFNVSAFFNE